MSNGNEKEIGNEKLSLVMKWIGRGGGHSAALPFAINALLSNRSGHQTVGKTGDGRGALT
jgi:hypothetical protein